VSIAGTNVVKIRRLGRWRALNLAQTDGWFVPLRDCVRVDSVTAMLSWVGIEYAMQSPHPAHGGGGSRDGSLARRDLGVLGPERLRPARHDVVSGRLPCYCSAQPPSQ
jgi:hypothetical protein